MLYLDIMYSPSLKLSSLLVPKSFTYKTPFIWLKFLFSWTEQGTPLITFSDIFFPLIPFSVLIMKPFLLVLILFRFASNFSQKTLSDQINFEPQLRKHRLVAEVRVRKP